MIEINCGYRKTVEAPIFLSGTIDVRLVHQDPVSQKELPMFILCSLLEPLQQEFKKSHRYYWQKIIPSIQKQANQQKNNLIKTILKLVA